MTKQLNLDLAAALEDAQQGRDDGERVKVRSGSSYIQCKAVNAGDVAARLKNAHRKTRERGELRSYPKFAPGMSTAEYVVRFAAMNQPDPAFKAGKGAANVLPFDNLNTAPCGLYEGGAVDYEVAHEIEAEELPEVAPVQENQPVVSLFTGNPDPKNSAAMEELEGFKPGDVVDVKGRTIGRSTIELLYRRAMAGFDNFSMARIIGANGKKLDVLLTEIAPEAQTEPETTECADMPTENFAHDVPGAEPVAPPAQVADANTAPAADPAPADLSDAAQEAAAYAAQVESMMEMADKAGGPEQIKSRLLDSAASIAIGRDFMEPVDAYLARHPSARGRAKAIADWLAGSVTYATGSSMWAQRVAAMKTESTPEPVQNVAPPVAQAPEVQAPPVAVSPKFAALMSQAREARKMAREAIARAKASSAQAVCISSTPKATQPTQAQPASAVRFMAHYVTDGKNKAKVRYYASQDRSGRAFVDVDAKHHGAQLGRMLPGVRNDTDTMTDYFCKDSVRIYSGSPLYPAALARVNANEATRDARRAKRRTA